MKDKQTEMWLAKLFRKEPLAIMSIGPHDQRSNFSNAEKADIEATQIELEQLGKPNDCF